MQVVAWFALAVVAVGVLAVIQRWERDAERRADAEAWAGLRAPTRRQRRQWERERLQFARKPWSARK